MGFYYRKRTGPFWLSMSRRGPRVGIGWGPGSGCLLTVLFVLGFIIATVVLI